MKKIFLLLATLLFSASCSADPRIYNFVYDTDTVFPIYTKLGEAFLLQFENDENFIEDKSTIGMGDHAAWSVGVRGNGVSMKPKAIKPETNLLIVTNKRTYAFDIHSSSPQHPPTFIVRFRYPDVEVANAERQKLMAENKAMQNLAVERANDTKKLIIDSVTSKVRPVFNSMYSWVGNHSMLNPKVESPLKPTAAWDDGRFTHLSYDSAVAMPNFYKLTSDGTESLLNTHIDPQEPNTVILQEVLPKVIIRLGNEVMELVNDAYVVPVFNSTGTGDFDSLRVINQTKEVQYGQ